MRSNPYSQYYEDYNIDNISVLLNDNNIIYRNYKSEFGARQEDTKYFTDGYLDFTKYVKSNEFQQGLSKIAKGMELGYTFALMCAEKAPATCHRTIMIARELQKIGYEVKHITADNTLLSQQEIEQELVDFYYPDREQLSMFAEELSWDEMVHRSYQHRNKEIGYRHEYDRIAGVS